MKNLTKSFVLALCLITASALCATSCNWRRPAPAEMFHDGQTGEWHRCLPDDGRYPITRIRKINYDDIYDLSKQELRIMRNEIFARHGYIFSSPDLQTYFYAQPWYKPVSKNVSLNAIERYNVDFIKSFE